MLALLEQGRSNRQIAEQLFISGKTVSNHISAIFARLVVRARIAADIMIETSEHEGVE